MSQGRLWLGTDVGVFSVDMGRELVSNFVGRGDSLEERVIWIGTESDHAWAVTRGGITLFESGLPLYFPFQHPKVPRSELITMDTEFIWIAYGVDVRRFSKTQRRWDDVVEMPQLPAAALRLSKSAAGDLVAITDGAVFVYEQRFKSWSQPFTRRPFAVILDSLGADAAWIDPGQGRTFFFRSGSAIVNRDVLERMMSTATSPEDLSIWVSDGWAVTSKGIKRLESALAEPTYFPFPRPTVPDPMLIAMDTESIWVGSSEGLQRFSMNYRRWDADVEVPQLPAPPLRLLQAQAPVAITDGGVFIYEQRYRSWARLDN